MTTPDDEYAYEEQPREGRKVIKIFPRNLTARADYLVPGNPVTSRPESGVDNCYPGLEMDQRNLDQRFFPGLYFEYARDDGAILAELNLTAAQKKSGLIAEDLSPTRPLFLWAIYGKFSPAEKEPSFFAFHQLTGADALRRVHDLLPGRVAIAFGPRPNFLFSASPFFAAELVERLHAAYVAKDDVDKFVVARDGAGLLRFAVFSEERTQYLDDEGVINVETFPPGELTKSLCAPWIFDFRDCICFYWASNKPDMAESEGRPNLNFLRERLDPATGEPLPPPRPTTIYSEWREQIMKHGVIISGAWRDLPIVLDDREVPDEPLPMQDAPAAAAFDCLENVFKPSEARNELQYLATVEHALIVEYLFAHYSLKAPPKLPEETVLGSDEHRIFTAAADLLNVAIDEMRHFFWVNQLLRLLGCKRPVTSRAGVIGLPPSEDTERKRRTIPNFKYLDMEFGLRPLTRDVLSGFVKIEANSRTVGHGRPGDVSFGMYIHLLASFNRRRKLEHRDEIIDLVKLLIDEGEDHGKVFKRIGETLSGLDEEEYLRPFKGPDDGGLGKEQEQLLKLCDIYYESFLRMLHVSYALGPEAGGELIANAVLLMRQLHEAGHQLAAQNIPLRFTEPDQKAIRSTLEKRGTLAALEEIQLKTMESLRAVQVEAESPQVNRMAQRHMDDTRVVYEKLKQVAVRPDGKTHKPR